MILADWALFFRGLMIPDFLRCSSSSMRPLTLLVFQGLRVLLCLVLGAKARQFQTSFYFCYFSLSRIQLVTFERVFFSRQAVGANIYSILLIIQPIFSSMSNSRPSEAYFSYIYLQDGLDCSTFLVKWWVEMGLCLSDVMMGGLLMIVLTIFWIWFFLSYLTLLRGDQGQLALWISLMFYRLQIQGMIMSFWKWADLLCASPPTNFSIIHLSNKFKIECWQSRVKQATTIHQLVSSIATLALPKCFIELLAQRIDLLAHSLLEIIAEVAARALASFDRPTVGGDRLALLILYIEGVAVIAGRAGAASIILAILIVTQNAIALHHHVTLVAAGAPTIQHVKCPAQTADWLAHILSIEIGPRNATYTIIG